MSNVELEKEERGKSKNPSTSTSTRRSHEILFLMPGDFLSNNECRITNDEAQSSNSDDPTPGDCRATLPPMGIHSGQKGTKTTDVQCQSSRLKAQI